jgi:hypothetical protein
MDPPPDDREYDLQRMIDLHRQRGQVVNSVDGGDPIIIEERHGGRTDLTAADRHTGTGEGASKGEPAPDLY